MAVRRDDTALRLADPPPEAALKIGAKEVDVSGEGPGRMNLSLRARVLHLAGDVARPGSCRVSDMTRTPQDARETA